MKTPYLNKAMGFLFENKFACLKNNLYLCLIKSLNKKIYDSRRISETLRCRGKGFQGG
jgi:hypothetical protein